MCAAVVVSVAVSASSGAVAVAVAAQELLSARAKGATRLKPLLLDQVSVVVQHSSPCYQPCTHHRGCHMVCRAFKQQLTQHSTLLLPGWLPHVMHVTHRLRVLVGRGYAQRRMLCMAAADRE